MEVIRPPAILPFCAALSLAFGALPASGRGQQPTGAPRPWPVTVSHYAKWPVLATSALLFTRAALDRRTADRREDELSRYCEGLTAGCPQATGGRYLDQRAQALADAADRAGGRAHALIMAAQLSLVATGTMFLVDLVHDSSDPPNIPYAPFSVYAAPGRLGFAARF